MRHSHSMESDKHKISPRVKSLLGSIKVPEKFDYKKELSDSLDDKNPDK